MQHTKTQQQQQQQHANELSFMHTAESICMLLLLLG